MMTGSGIFFSGTSKLFIKELNQKSLLLRFSTPKEIPAS